MDPEAAKKLLVEGATFVLLNMPAGSEFGIDMNLNRTGDKFRGVKLIPPGLHFIYYSAVDKEGQEAPRTGFFHFFKPKEMLVRKWDRRNEDISSELATDEEIERLKQNLQGTLDRFLAPYDYESWRQWISLTNFITEDILERLQPEEIKIYSVTQFIPSQYPPAPGTDTTKVPELLEQPEKALKFTEFPKNRYPDNCTPSEITKHCMDSTYVLETLLKTGCSVQDLLGELQFAFICFLNGQLYLGFEQWKKLVHTFCTSVSAIEKYGDLYSDLITVLHFQIKEIPSDFFVDIVSQENFLTMTLSRFFTSLLQSEANSLLKNKGKRFKESLTKKFKWSFEEETEDEAPVVVDTSEPLF